MSPTSINTPGIYIDQINELPNSIVPVATAVPAFIGYTPQASMEGKSYTNKAVKISSFAQFKSIYCLPDPPAPADAARQYSPQYYLKKQQDQQPSANSLQIDGAYYSILPDPHTVYYFYNSIRMFFENGGADAYIVSVGGYGDPSGKPIAEGHNLINPNVKLNELLGGLAILENETEPTMYVCPEATLLSVDNNSTLMQAMLVQCEKLATAISIFDLIGAKQPDLHGYTQDIESFRNSTGTRGLSYGVAYYPFIGTTLMQPGELTFDNLFGADLSPLEALLNPPTAPDPVTATVLQNIKNQQPAGTSVCQYDAELRNASMLYKRIISKVLEDANLVPPSGAMAGIITATDNAVGVWEAPANTSIVGAVSLPINLTDDQQADLNIDAMSGKSVNALRFFNGKGILVWGARTLDGNSLDLRYIPVRRTLIFLEQSCKLAMQAYVFEPNDANTWGTVKSTLSSFLTNVWKQGGLHGASPADAFGVELGLNSTMTDEDVLNGIMRVSIRVAVAYPAEYFFLNIEQQMANSA